MAARQARRFQRGAALLIVLILLVMGGLAYVVNSLAPGAIAAKRQKKTEAALAEAQEALLGYAVSFREQQNAIQVQAGNLPPNYVHGYLPLPDLGTLGNTNIGCPWEGCDANLSGSALNKTVVGRFPWRLLGTRPLRDGNGECLWYAVSGSHQRVEKAVPMNWDTPGQLDLIVANAGIPAAAGLTEHQRPVAIIFSPGTALSSARGPSSTGAVTECGGNYTIGDYLESTNLGPPFDFPPSAAPNFVGADTATQPKPLGTQGRITLGGNLIANDIGLPITSDALFGAIRKNSNFRTEIGQMIERMATCARDEIAAASITTNAKIDTACSVNLDAFGPPGYYAHYRDQVFVAQCPSCQVTVDNVLSASCAGALIFGNQRDSGQNRRDATEKAAAGNYLEGDNLASFNANGDRYAGAGQLRRVSTTPPQQSIGQDIVHCLLGGASMVAATLPPTALPAGEELSRYDAATRTVTLGRANIESDQGYVAGKLFGCAWTPETHATGSGLRSYFRFNIGDAGDGFAFVAADGDLNGIGACGAGEQHLGYSGNNGYTPPILAPKIGLEIDTRYNFQSNPPYVPDGFNPARTLSASALRTLANGRADPNYAGGHIALIYWGGETPISTGFACGGGCRSPSFCAADNICQLNQEEDDNVHGQLPTAPALRPPPLNRAAPATPPTNPPYPPYSVDKLDPSLSAVPVGQTIHLRMEVTRAYAGRDDNSRLIRLAATANLTALSGLPSIDGSALQAGDTVLLTAQTDATANGVYVASVGAWSRAGSADEASELAPATSWFIKEGTANAGSLWRLENTETPTLGVSPLRIQRFRAPAKTVATGNIALAGLATVDGYSAQSGDRILLTGQTDSRENGVWIANAGNWQRAAPEHAAAGMQDGAMWFVSGGSHSGTYWRLNGDATPGNSSISIAPPAANDLYAARVTTQVWKESSNINQITRMKITTSAMAQLDPVIRHGLCAPSAPLCPAANPVDQYCGGTETDGLRYCYTGQQPKLHDSQKIYDRRGNACDAGVSCTADQFCGIDNNCYQPALRTARLGFTNSQSTQSQVITINDFFTTWLP